ncbi:hypothetical protein EVA_13833 [gut metagenome]|uniref:Uncharacterized protein n=1 Tax=gut metagenome TaxID=749906 RepID=J9FT03_9ZZZZ
MLCWSIPAQLFYFKQHNEFLILQSKAEHTIKICVQLFIIYIALQLQCDIM